MNQIWSILKKNWKTTVAGILVFVAGVLLESQVITQDVFNIIMSVLAALGFIIAKDGNKTGV